MTKNTKSVSWTKHDCCIDCLWFCSQITCRGGAEAEEKNWCDLTKESVHAYADACVKFLCGLRRGPQFQQKGEIEDEYKDNALHL